MTEWDKLQEGLPLYQVQGVFSGVPESDRDYTRRLKEYIKKLWTEGDKMQDKLEAVRAFIDKERSTIASPDEGFNEVREKWVHWFMDEIVKRLGG